MAGIGDALFSNLGVFGGLLKGLTDPSNMGPDLTQGLENGIQSAESAFGGAGGGSNPLTALSGSSFDGGGQNPLLSLSGM